MAGINWQDCTDFVEGKAKRFREELENFLRLNPKLKGWLRCYNYPPHIMIALSLDTMAKETRRRSLRGNRLLTGAYAGGAAVVFTDAEQELVAGFVASLVEGANLKAYRPRKPRGVIERNPGELLYEIKVKDYEAFRR